MHHACLTSASCQVTTFPATFGFCKEHESLKNEQVSIKTERVKFFFSVLLRRIILGETVKPEGTIHSLEGRSVNSRYLAEVFRLHDRRQQPQSDRHHRFTTNPHVASYTSRSIRNLRSVLTEAGEVCFNPVTIVLPTHKSRPPAKSSKLFRTQIIRALLHAGSD